MVAAEARVKSAQRGAPQASPRVLLVGPALAGGGAEGRFARIAANVFGGDVDVAVLHAGGEMASDRVFDLRWRGRASYPAVIARLRRILRARRYDVAMSFGLFPTTVTVLARAAARAGTRVVVHEISRPLAEAATAGRVRGALYTLMRRRLYRLGDRISANSIDGLSETCALVGADVSAGTRTFNAIDAGAIRARADEYFPVAQRPYAVTICRLDFMKRTETAIDAIARLPESDAIDLVVVGDGEARAMLEERARELGVRERIRFTGQLANPLPWLRGARAFVLTSAHEGFPNTMLEAMACGVPVITSHCNSDARDICARGAALGFEVGDAATLARLMDEVGRDAALRARLVDAAARYIEPHLIGNAIPHYERLLREVAAA